MRGFSTAVLFFAVCPAAWAQTGNSFVTSDGSGRAPAVTMHCVGSGNVAMPCGTNTLPLYVAGSISAGPANGTFVSRSASVPATQSTQLFPANAVRHLFALQAPAGSSLWVNFLGGVAAPNGTDCVQLSPGALYESGQFVTRSAVTVYTPVAASISAWEG